MQVVTFLGKLAKMGEVVEAVHVEDSRTEGTLNEEILQTAQAADVITWESAALLKAAQRRLLKAVASLELGMQADS